MKQLERPAKDLAWLFVEVERAGFRKSWVAYIKDQWRQSGISDEVMEQAVKAERKRRDDSLS